MEFRGLDLATDVIRQFDIRTCPNGAGPASGSVFRRLHARPIHGCPRQAPDPRHARQSIDATERQRTSPAHFLGLRRAKGRLFSRMSILMVWTASPQRPHSAEVQPRWALRKGTVNEKVYQDWS